MVEDELALFDKSINEFWNKFKSTVSDTSCQMAGLRDTYKDSIKALAGTKVATCFCSCLFFSVISAELKLKFHFLFQKSSL